MDKEQGLIKRFARCELTKSQIKIADYILKNQKRILGMTALEAGKEIGVSDASVIRFSRAVGYKGFTDLKEQIQKDLQENNEKVGKHSLHDRFVLQMEKYHYDAKEKNEMLYLMQTNLETSFRQNDEVCYEHIADKILKANKKVVIGLRGGKGCADQFARLLSFLTDNVHLIIDEKYDQIVGLQEYGKEDIAVFLNFPRYYKIDEKIGNILKEKGVPYILVTDSMLSPIAKYADEILLVETEHCGFFHSMIGVMGVLEYLLILMCWKQPEEFRKRLEERDYILEEYLTSK